MEWTTEDGRPYGGHCCRGDRPRSLVSYPEYCSPVCGIIRLFI